MANRLVPKKNAPHRDVVYTPTKLARRLVNHFYTEGTVLEPCLGNGAFYRVFPRDSRYWCELDRGKDFLKYRRRVKWIITNPPWSKFKEFLNHSLLLADNIVFLVTINHFTTKHRLKLVRDAGFGFVEIRLVKTPKSWPNSGFQVAAIYIRRNYTGRCA